MSYAKAYKTKYRKKHGGNVAIRLASVLFGLVLITTWMTGGLLAKYVAADSDEDSARVAAFVFRVQEELGRFEIPLDEVTSGSEKEYKFTVTNQTSNGLICETDQEYTITIKMNGSLPLVCTLYKEEKELGESKKTQLYQVDAMATDVSWPSVYSCAPVTLGAGEAKSESYSLEIEWPIKEEENGKRLNPIFAGGIAEVEIQITSVQID